MSDKKQTAVEWLEDMMMVNGFIIPLTLFKQTKQMHKEQIKDAYSNGVVRHLHSKTILSEEYYNETYGKDNENNN